ncbi:MAG TPA: phosphoribosylaminoimidazolesuccinocarboxamide synthase [Acidimicrobiia bacterium]|jgi:phosphoribosylaminoimidazole-succinocarboxamide synthase|nr:phosphoribosylaminoimidazolesuccinocarboxamide synthase [Acidimicrobiia bacterium]
MSGKTTALKHIYSGKVRELYAVEHDALLMVASDRVSVFDVVLPDDIPDKGRVLTALSYFWFEQTQDIVANHVISCDPTDFPPMAGDVAGRATLVRSTQPLRLECVVRGYVFGGGWKEYTEQGTVGGFAVPAGLQQAEQLPQPLFTPSTKAESGHDLPLTADEAVALVGADVYERVKDYSLRLYELGARHAATRGVILADTKFEFGERDGEILVIDEMMTPDSSRYWPADEYEPGTSPPSFDKQYVRDYMDSTGWAHEPPAPHVPADVIANTRAKYVEAYELVTGLSFGDWYGPDDD